MYSAFCKRLWCRLHASLLCVCFGIQSPEIIVAEHASADSLRQSFAVTPADPSFHSMEDEPDGAGAALHPTASFTENPHDLP